MAHELWPARLHHLRRDSPKPEPLARFYGELLGDRVESLAGDLWLVRGERRNLLVGKGAAGSVPYFALQMRDAAQLNTFSDQLEKLGVRRGERILLKTRNSRDAWKGNGFVEDFVYLSTEAAEWLAKRRVRSVGIDYLSVGGYKKNGAAVHHALLDAGVWIIEGLDLSRAPAGPCELICLPLKLVGSDGSPARAILRPLRRK